MERLAFEVKKQKDAIPQVVLWCSLVGEAPPYRLSSSNYVTYPHRRTQCYM